jgi:hypothetical protein
MTRRPAGLTGIGRLTTPTSSLIAAVAAVLLLCATSAASPLTLRGLPNYVPAVISCASDGSCTTAGSQWSDVNSVKSVRGQMTTGVDGYTTALTTVQLPANANATNPNVGFGAFGCDFGIGTECLVGAGSAKPHTLACASSGNCTAVGSYLDTAGNYDGLLLTETNGVWAPGVEAQISAALPAVPPGQNAQLRFVSLQCVSAGNCTAVATLNDLVFFGTAGSTVDTGYTFAGADSALAFTESGGVWSAGQLLQAPSDSHASGNVTLTSLSCPDAGDCAAVGDYTATHAQWGFIATETDGVWAQATPVAAPSAPASVLGTTLGAVSCSGIGECTAVGSVTVAASSGRYEEPLAATESGGTWGTSDTLNMPANAITIADAQAAQSGLTTIDLLSCSSAGNCDAAGSYVTGGLTQGMFITESNGSWQTETQAADPAGGDNTTSVTDLSCSSAGDCAAIGLSGGAASNLLFSESGGTWSGGTAPQTTTGHAGTLFSVSCPIVGSCTASGSADNAPFEVKLGRAGWLPATKLTNPPSHAQLLTTMRSLLSIDRYDARAGAGRRQRNPTTVARWFTALEPGRVVVLWHVKSGRRSVLMAQAILTVSSTGPVKLHVKLTSAGKKLLKNGRALKVSDQITLTSVGMAAQSAATTFTLPKPPKKKH